jgi:hypothetical protein
MTKLSKLEKLIYEVRRQAVMLDSDLANLYQVETRTFNQAVKRNASRFPKDFMFQLTRQEWEFLRSQFVISNIQENRGGRRFLPHVFTENGVAMLSSVLNSDKAIKMNIQIMRAFTRMRQYVSLQSDVNIQISDIRKILTLYMESNDKRVTKIYTALEALLPLVYVFAPEERSVPL